MIFARYRDLFDACLPAFWPWLWLQLAILLAHKAADGRERLIMVTWWGKVFVLAIGDDPSAPKPWTPAQVRLYVRPLGAALHAYNAPYAVQRPGLATCARRPRPLATRLATPRTCLAPCLHPP